MRSLNDKMAVRVEAIDGKTRVRLTKPNGDVIAEKILLQDGEKKAFRVDPDVILRVGNAKAANVTVDGQSYGVMGKAALPVEWRIQQGKQPKTTRLSYGAGVDLASLAARLQELALERGISVGTAESCTGGLIGHSLTAITGSSAYYRGRCRELQPMPLKVDLLGVPAEAIERHGAVSAQVAVAMADGARTRLGCDYAVSVTGVAGPDGGTLAKPVGLTYVAAAGPLGHEVGATCGTATGRPTRNAARLLPWSCC